MLIRLGYHVLVAESGEAALALADSHSGDIDLVLTDVAMPSMSGRQLADRFLLLRPKTKFLFMSGYTDSAIVHHGVLDQGTQFIGKPFSPTALAQKVCDTLDSATNGPAKRG